MRQLNILLVEDSETDARLLEHHLDKGGICYDLTRVDNRTGLDQALVRGGWDLVLTDFVLPGYDGLSVVRRVLEWDPEIPCIVISGHVGEEYAVEAMRVGARDFITKSNLSRLLSAVNREILSEEDRRAARLSKIRLQESEAKFKAISEAAQDGIIMMDPEGRVSFWNPAAERIFGFTGLEALGKDLHALVAPGPELDAFQGLFPDFSRTGEGRELGKTAQVLALTKDRREIHIELSLSKVHYQNGWHGIGIVRDVSQRIALEAEQARMEFQLHQAQKMEAIGQLAAGIAHEINTPIQYIGDNTVFYRDVCAGILKFLGTLRDALGCGPLCEADQASLQRGLDALDLDYLGKEIPKAIQQSLDGVARVSRIVSAMKDFSHPSQGAKSPVDLNRAIESTVLVCRNEWKYCAEMELELDPELPPVPCIADEFNQVVLNLVVNAAHAIESALAQRGQGGLGLIRIGTRRLERMVEIRVGDTGTGIPEGIRARIFDPFFTTKPVGKGTGQGLAIAHSIIVEKHGGRIRLETEPGKGTTFILELPL